MSAKKVTNFKLSCCISLFLYSYANNFFTTVEATPIQNGYGSNYISVEFTCSIHTNASESFTLLAEAKSSTGQKVNQKVDCNRRTTFRNLHQNTSYTIKAVSMETDLGECDFNSDNITVNTSKGN